ncbi:MAG: hypothetical protein JWO95_1749 [Verrucomicrobiales bacterium]|nr:hypothetical protein [Verrucomicrobiales bacterium]
MLQLPAPHYLKAVELGIIDPEAIVPREWIYDFCVLCPATPADCVGFFRQYGATSEVDDNTYIALVAGGFFRKILEPAGVAELLAKRFTKQAHHDAGLRRCLEQLQSEFTSAERAQELCVHVLTPYQELAERLLGDLPCPNEFSLGR